MDMRVRLAEQVIHNQDGVRNVLFIQRQICNELPTAVNIDQMR